MRLRVKLTRADRTPAVSASAFSTPEMQAAQRISGSDSMIRPACASAFAAAARRRARGVAAQAGQAEGLSEKASVVASLMGVGFLGRTLPPYRRRLAQSTRRTTRR